MRCLKFLCALLFFSTCTNQVDIDPVTAELLKDDDFKNYIAIMSSKIAALDSLKKSGFLNSASKDEGTQAFADIAMEKNKTKGIEKSQFYYHKKLETKYIVTKKLTKAELKLMVRKAILNNENTPGVK